MNHTNQQHAISTLLTAGLVRGMLMLLIAFGSLQLTAQPFQGWEVHFGGISEDVGFSLVHTADHGFLAVGFSESFDNAVRAYLVRTDVDGDLVWQTVIPNGFRSFAYDVIRTSDDNFLIAGSIRPTPLDDFRAMLAKVNDNGEVLWVQSYGGSERDDAYSVIETTDGGYLLAGRTNSSGNGGSDAFVVKTDADGNELWSETFGGLNNEQANQIIEITDGYIFVGQQQVTPPNSRIFVVKIDFDGTEIWSENYTFGNSVFGNAILENNSGEFIIAGTEPIGGIVVMKINAVGGLVWNQYLGGGEGQGNDLLLNDDGTIMIVGAVVPTPDNGDIYFAKISDLDGSPIWERQLGSPQLYDEGRGLVATADGGYAFSGNNSLSGIFINDLTLIKTNADGDIYTSIIRGNVYNDLNEDCIRQAGEPGMEDWVVRASGATQTYYGTTNANGTYAISVDTGIYNVELLLKNTYWIADCNPVFPGVEISGFYDTTLLSFPVRSALVDNCPYLSLQVATSFLIPCEEATYTVNYLNEGPGIAEDAEIRIELDANLTLVSATLPISGQEGNTYFFGLGNVPSSAKGSFEVRAQVACDLQANETVGVRAFASPALTCSPGDAGWDGSSTKVEATCIGDQVRLVIRNEGVSAMSAQREYIVIEDEIMGMFSPFELGSGDSTVILVEATGATVRLIAQQAPGHPGKSYPTIAVEGCTSTGGAFSTGMVNMFPEDSGDDHVSVDIQESVANGLVATLRGYPKGYRGDTIAVNTDIEYHIVFQNTGNDTIHRVVIRDTLPTEFLDIESIRFGASSHPADYILYNNGVLKAVLDDIVLPPASVNEAASYGFIKFRLSQKPNNPVGAEIVNQALLFVGYQTPAISNIKRHVVGGELFDFVEIILDTQEPIAATMPTVLVFPNPFADATTILVDEPGLRQVTLHVFDLTGRQVRREQFSGNQVQVNRNGLSAGTYVFRLESEGRLLGSGKMIVR